MGLYEGEIRKNGLPAKKPGYPRGSRYPNVGRPQRTTCALPGCELPTMPKGSRGPNPQYCSVQHRNLHYRQGHVGRRYGITIDDYTQKLAEQGGVCAICGSADPKASGRKPRGRPELGKGSFHIDHDHISGKFRGLLCGGCNRGLGQFQDSLDILERAAAYLRNSLNR